LFTQDDNLCLDNSRLDKLYLASSKVFHPLDLVSMIQAEILEPASTSDRSRPGAVPLLDISTEQKSHDRAVGFFEAFHNVFHHMTIRDLKTRMKRKGERKGKQKE